MKTAKTRRVSVRSIARAANVSHATVSYVLSDRGRQYRIPERTEKRVRQMAEQLGWQPNHVRSSFFTGQTRLVGIWQAGFGEPYQAWVMQTMERVLRQDGYAILASPANAQGVDEEYDLSLFNKWSADGLIALSGPKWIHRFLESHPNWWLPTVSMGPFVLADNPRVDSVYVDVLSPVYEGLNRWLTEGRRRIAMLSGHGPDADETYPREQLYRQFVSRHGLPEELIVFPKGGSQRINAEIALCEYLPRHGCPEAIFCRCDETAMGAYRALRRLGRVIPDDVALLGVDGIQDTLYLDQPLATVVQPVEEMCKRAWQLLQERLTDPDKPASHEMITATLRWLA